MLRQPDPMEEPEPGPEAWQAQPLPMGEGPGLDGSQQHEMAEMPQFEQQEGPEAGERVAQ